MSPLTQINLAVASYVPGWAWDWINVTVGLLVLTGVFFQRRFGDGFNWSSSSCTVDSFFLWIRQAGIAMMGTLAAMLIFDGLWPGESPPRTFVALTLLVYFAIQSRTVYQAITQSVKRSIEAVIG